MRFEFQPKIARRPEMDATTFTIESLRAKDGERIRDLTHLVDRSYPYQSARELRWHLAERFRLPVDGVELHVA